MNNDQALSKIETILYSSVPDAEKTLRIESVINKSHRLIFKTIHELLDYDFIVPSYQRGYKWKKQQVEDLLNDILEFAKTKPNGNQFYCLQPIIVKKEETSWEVIDGQQRLTTIYLILSYLGANSESGLFSLEYNTRNASKTFLKKLTKASFTGAIKDDNIDIYHFTAAMSAIKEWFDKKDELTDEAPDRILWQKTLLYKTRIIWYNPESTGDNQSEIDIFSRINSGKIPLTNSELIRALFIHHSKKSAVEEVALLQQNKIATEWDHIEQQLHDEDFWCFVKLGDPFGKKEYPNRIEFFFDLIEQKEKGKAQEDDKYSTFRMYNDWLITDERISEEKDRKKLSELWQEIKNLFYRFHEWHIDRELYHLTGYARLAGTGMTTETLLGQADELKQSELAKNIKGQIRKCIFNNGIKNKIEGTEKQEPVKYGDGDIRKILLLFNIALATQDEHTARFNFRSYTKDNKWDIEHIRSQTLSGKEARIWLKNVQNKLPKPLPEEVINSLSEEEVNTLTKKTHKKLEQTEPDSGCTDDLGNLCLLDASTNRGYGNAIFADKRKTIIERIGNGQFVPQGTQNIFLKVYSEDLGEMKLWQKSDAVNYQTKMMETIRTLLGGD